MKTNKYLNKFCGCKIQATNKHYSHFYKNINVAQVQILLSCKNWKFVFFTNFLRIDSSKSFEYEKNVSILANHFSIQLLWELKFAHYNNYNPPTDTEWISVLSYSTCTSLNLLTGTKVT